VTRVAAGQLAVGAPSVRVLMVDGVLTSGLATAADVSPDSLDRTAPQVCQYSTKYQSTASHQCQWGGI